MGQSDAVFFTLGAFLGVVGSNVGSLLITV